MVASETVLDTAMVYFDARLSQRYPTIRVRVADVCLHSEDAVLIAALVRALVDTAAKDWAAGREPDPVRTEVLNLAAWRAGRSGLAGELIDPTTRRPLPPSPCLPSPYSSSRASISCGQGRNPSCRRHVLMLLIPVSARGVGLTVPGIRS